MTNQLTEPTAGASHVAGMHLRRAEALLESCRNRNLESELSADGVPIESYCPDPYDNGIEVYADAITHLLAALTHAVIGIGMTLNEEKQ